MRTKVIMESDVLELGDMERIMLFILDKNPMKVREFMAAADIMRNATSGVYGPFEDNTDDVEEAINTLSDIGIIEQTDKGMTISDYGQRLRKFVIDQTMKGEI